MKTKISRKLISVSLAVAILVSLGMGFVKVKTTALNVTKKIKISMMVPVFKSSPVGTVIQNEWEKRVKKYLNIDIEFDYKAVNYGDMGDKIKVMLASNSMPDIAYLYDNKLARSYGDNGALLNLAKYKKDLKFMSKYIRASGGDRAIYGSDNKLYVAYNAGSSVKNGSEWNWIFRKDVFEKNKIKVPETLDEFYNAAKKLKQLYPNSYPISGDAGWNAVWQPFMAVNHISDGWYGMFWDGSKYLFGPTNSRFKETIEFMHKLYVEGLLDPEFLTMNGDQMKKKALNGTSFFIPTGWSNQIGELNQAAEKPVEWAGMLPVNNPKYGTAYHRGAGAPGLTLSSNYGGAVINGHTKYPEILVKLVDYQYSDEMSDLINWGIKGKTYSISTTGAKEFLKGYKGTQAARDSLSKLGVASAMDCRAGMFNYPNNREAVRDAQLPAPFYAKGKYYNNMSAEAATAKFGIVTAPDGLPSCPTSKIVANFTKEESDLVAAVGNPCSTYWNEAIIKFIIGETSLDKWNDYVAELDKLGNNNINKIVDMFNKYAKNYTK